MLLVGTTGFLGQSFLPNADLIPVSRAHYDFARPDFTKLTAAVQTHRPGAAIITAAVASPDECKRQPELSHAVNVSGTIALFRFLKEWNIKPIFFSTDHVYDGQKGLYTEDDDYCPLTLYGRQKVEAETFLRQNFSDYLILRTSKQVATRVDRKNVLSEQALRLKNHEPIRCATDHWIAPSFVEDIVQVTLRSQALQGIYNIVSDRVFSRYEIGEIIVSTMGAAQELLVPCSIHDFKFIEVRPPLCTLNGDKLRQALPLEMTSLRRGLALLLQKI